MTRAEQWDAAKVAAREERLAYQAEQRRAWLGVPRQFDLPASHVVHSFEAPCGQQGGGRTASLDAVSCPACFVMEVS